MPPDTFRLRYRNELAAAVSEILRGGLAADEAAAHAVLPAAVVAEDRPRFVALTLAEFKTIHPGKAIRFGLRPLEFSAWLERETGRE